MRQFSKAWVRQKTVHDPFLNASILIGAAATGILALTAGGMLPFVSAFITVALSSFIGAFVVYFIALAAIRKDDEAKISLLSYWSIFAFALSLTHF